MYNHISLEIMTVAVVVISTALVLLVTRRERKLCRDTMHMFGDALLGYERQLHRAMMLIKASTPVEAAQAENEHKSMDLKVKYLEDALAQAKHDADEKKEPMYVKTTDGRKFDVNELEVF